MATDAKTITVESSPTQILASMTAEDRKVWRQTGNLPEPKTEAASSPAKEEVKETKPAESSPAAESEVPEKKAGASDAPPAEPVKKNAESRIKELLADNKKLANELESLRKAPLHVQAKIEEVAKPRRNDLDSKTGQAKYASEEAFEAAYEEYLTAKVTGDVEKRHAKQMQETRIAEQNRIQQQRWQNSLKLAMERHSDFAKVCELDKDGKFQSAELKTIKDNGVLDAFCLDSEIGAQILYHLAAHPGEVRRIQEMSSFAAARELTRLEDRLSGSRSGPGERQAAGSPKRNQGPPTPPAEVGGKGSAPRDEEEAAAEAGDFRRYMKAANENEFRKKRKAS